MPVQYYFPTPIYHSFIKNDVIHSQIDYLIENLRKDELSSPWCDNVKTTFRFNATNNISNKIPLLEKEVTNHCTMYLNEVLSNDQQNYDLSIIESWINISNKNNFQHYHNHTSDISVVFYHQTNEKDGDIIFTNPSLASRLNKLTMKINTIRYTPQKGKIIIFPSFLEHAVNMNETDHPRISIAFNVGINNIQNT